MEFIDILPILIPVGLFQVFLQVYAIKHVWDQKQIKENIRILWVIMIMFFNLIAITIYFFYIYSKDQEPYPNEVSPHFRRGVLVLVFIAFQIFIIQLVIFPNQFLNETLVVYLGMSIYLTLILNEILLSLNKDKYTYFISILLWVGILFLEYFTKSNPTHFLTLIITVSILNVIPIKYQKYTLMLLFPTYLLFNIIKADLLFVELNSDPSVAFIYTNTLIFVLVYLSFAALKRQVVNNRTLNELIKKLEHQSKTIEEMTAKEERGRIAADIHDHVGHTLTTAIINLESIIPLLPKDSPLVEKIDLSKEQVRFGLNQIRTLVSNVDLNLDLSLESQIQQMINDFQSKTGISIQLDIDGQFELLPIYKRVITNAIKEFFTNSIKHGNATEIHILISKVKNDLDITLSNNGKKSDEVNYGFGLSNMNKNISSLGGYMKVLSSNDIGFSIYFKIPIGENAHE